MASLRWNLSFFQRLHHIRSWVDIAICSAPNSEHVWTSYMYNGTITSQPALQRHACVLPENCQQIGCTSLVEAWHSTKSGSSAFAANNAEASSAKFKILLVARGGKRFHPRPFGVLSMVHWLVLPRYWTKLLSVTWKQSWMFVNQHAIKICPLLACF